MSEPNLEELNESIKLLSKYRDRLNKEVTLIAKKLQMSPKAINSTLKDNSELTKINHIIINLISQRENQLEKKHLEKTLSQ